jgi:hypothetical protein
MLFKLTGIRNRIQKTFSTKDILGLVGDRVNDEIRFGKEKYRISSLQEVDAGDGNSGNLIWQPEWIKVNLIVTESGQVKFPFEPAVSDPEGLFLVVNGAMFDHGSHSAFHVEGSSLFWHSLFQLETTDVIYIKFLTLNHN